MSAAGTSESSVAPTGSSEASRSKADIRVTKRGVRDLRNCSSAAHSKESQGNDSLSLSLSPPEYLSLSLSVSVSLIPPTWTELFFDLALV